MRSESWQDYPGGVNNETGEVPASFTREEWDIGSEQLIGLAFEQLIPELIKESRFHPTMFNPESWIADYHGGIIQAQFKPYKPQTHETPGQHRVTDHTIDSEYWIGVGVGPDRKFSNVQNYNPLQDEKLKKEGYVVGWGSRVTLNNLNLPGTFGGWGHFPMLDLIKPPTKDNVDHVIKEVEQRCGLEKFLVLRSSKQGMMVVGVEVVDEENLLNFWNNAMLINHYETDKDDVWVDTRWVARSQQNYRRELGLPNKMQVAGILRVTAEPALKPEKPVVVAASF